MRHEVTLLEVQPPQNWITVWNWRESINRMPLQTLCSGTDFPPSRVPLEHVNSAGVDSKSAAEKGSLGDTTFHLSSALVLLIVRTMRNLPSKSTTMWRGRLKAESKLPRLRASRIELVRSFQNRVSEPHAFTEPCQRRADLAHLSSPEWRESVCSDRKSLERRGVPSTLSDAGQHRALQHVFLNNCLRRSHEAPDSQDDTLSNPIACRRVSRLNIGPIRSVSNGPECVVLHALFS